MFRKLRSNQIRRHSLNLSHVVVKNGLLATAIPFDGYYARPIRFSDGATVGLIVSPTNAVADFEQSGLIAGHCATCRSRDVEPVLDLVNSRWPVASDLLNRQCAHQSLP
jgi:hypothetical protein